MIAKTLTKTLHRIARLVARPLRGQARERALILHAYRGYGSRHEVFLIGRVLRQPASRRREPGADRDLIDLVRGILRRGVVGARIRAGFAGDQVEVETDRDGYYRVHLKLNNPPPSDTVWHPMSLELLGPEPLRTEAEIFIPPARSSFVVISDIDDTIVYTGVANKLKMLWRLFVHGADRRVAFPGIAALLTALHHGRGGDEANPMLYVSRGPWAIYDVLDAFFGQNGFPPGPLLFLREWGLTLQRPLPRRAKGHKLALIRHMVACYADKRLVLIGDSGQRDPENYAKVVHENPGRVLAIYIREIQPNPARRAAIDKLAGEVAAAGSILVLLEDSFAMARHAAQTGLISEAALADVLAERDALAEEAAA
jgi:phosphatidate phosphatase APP1